jgi:hypothetical protein
MRRRKISLYQFLAIAFLLGSLNAESQSGERSIFFVGIDFVLHGVPISSM